MTDLPAFPKDVSADRYERLLNPQEPFDPRPSTRRFTWSTIGGLLVLIALFWMGVTL